MKPAPPAGMKMTLSSTPQPDDAVSAKEFSEHLKKLETRIVRARESLRKLDEENGSLKSQVRSLKAENRELQSRTKQLQENAKRSIMSRGRMNLAKAKIQEIIKRIEQVEAEGELARNED